MSCSDDGPRIDESEEQLSNAPFSTDEILETESNVTVEREAQREKQHPPIFSTNAGMQIDDREEQFSNAAY
jgi:hypothetical protein